MTSLIYIWIFKELKRSIMQIYRFFQKNFVVFLKEKITG